MREAAIVGMALALLVSCVSRVNASGGAGENGAQPPPAPASQGQAAVTDGVLEAGSSGTYQPIPPDTLGSQTESNHPLSTPPAGVNPQGQQCPPPSLFTKRNGGSYGPDIPGGGVKYLITIHPYFTRNAQGGYDGHDSSFQYEQPNAIVPGGDPSLTGQGQFATATNIAGHIIAVDAFLQQWGSWQDAQQTPPYGGYCSGATFWYSPPYIAGNAPPPPPSQTVLSTPPFPLGTTLVGEVSRSWHIGSLHTLPGPDNTTRTYVHIPTCAWMQSSVPTAPLPLHSVTTATVAGYTLFLVYNVQVTPGPVTWDWGDSTQSITASALEGAPATLPSYDPTAQTWTDPCSISHAYASVADGRTITATETFNVSITVSWSDGVSVHTASVPCDPATGGSCTLTIGAAQGWASGPHPVDQIEPVPYTPAQNP